MLSLFGWLVGWLLGWLVAWLLGRVALSGDAAFFQRAKTFGQ
jgi:hypothetical protein